MLSRLQQRYLSLLSRHTTAAERATFSPALKARYEALLPRIQQHVRGTFIDLGCGQTPFRPWIEPRVEVYHTLDIQPREGLTYVADLTQMPQVPSQTYDSAICLDVLEHTPRPWMALKEIFRILKPGGTLILSVPHLSRIHEAPHDYYRFTYWGLQVLLKDAGFTVQEIHPFGGLFTFLGHQVSLFLLAATAFAPLIGPLVRWLNRYLALPLWQGLDRLARTPSLFPLFYVVVAHKPQT